MRISVVIPTKDRPYELRRCLLSILDQRRLPDEIVIVDASKEPTDLLKDSQFKQLNLLYIHSQPGITAQKNLGASKARGEVLIFLDDDVVLEKDYIKVVAEEFENNPELGGVTGLIVNLQDKRIMGINSLFRRVIWRSKFGDGRFTSYGVVRYITSTSKRREVEFMPGGNTAIKSQIWREVRFDENLKGYALCEDEDFSYRVSRNHKIIFTPEARLKHFQRPLKPLESKNLNRELIKNRYYLFKKNFPQTLRSRLGFAVMVIGILLHRLLNHNWAGVRGVIEGCLAMSRLHQNQTAQYH